MCVLVCPIELSQSQPGFTTCPKDPKHLGIPRYLGLILFSGSLVIFWLLRSGLGFSFFFIPWGLKLTHSWIWAPPYRPLMGLDFSYFFLYWKSECFTFLSFNPLCCFGTWYNIVIFLDLNNVEFIVKCTPP